MSSVTNKQAGRPSAFTPEIAGEIIDRLAGGQSLRKICDDAHMPDRATVIRWLADERHTAFRDQYARAREAQADALFEEALDIADTHELGEKRTMKADGGVEVVKADMIEHRRLRVDTRKWMAGKLAPKKYGEKIALEHSVDDSLARRLEAARLRAREK